MSKPLSTPKRPWHQANADGRALRDLFPPTCYSVWKAAGSVRRKRPEVGDVEHVIVPNHGEIEVTGGLFAETKTVNLLWFHLDALVKKGDVTKAIYGDQGFRWGEKYRGVSFRGFTHEFFTADVDNLGAILAIRTGPAEFSKGLVTCLLSRGYRNHEGYVWRCSPCPHRDGDGFCMPVEGQKCATCDGTGLIPVEKVPAPDEQAYFDLCGVKWIPPEARC